MNIYSLLLRGVMKMPWFDRTGPRGTGPMTGKGFGLCGGMRMRRGVDRRAGWDQYEKDLETELVEVRKMKQEFLEEK